MPVLDADALKTDPAGMAFLRGVFASAPTSGRPAPVPGPAQRRCKSGLSERRAQPDAPGRRAPSPAGG